MSGSPQHHAAWRSFAKLSKAELSSLLRQRCEGFVVEQQCAYLDIEFDGYIESALLDG